MNVRRRSGKMDHPMGAAIKNAVTQRKDSDTIPKPIKGTVTTAKSCDGMVRNACTSSKC